MRDLVFSMVGNMENRRAMMQKSPDTGRTLNDRMWSTDDCENEFAIIVLRCSFKPRWVIVAGLLKSIDELQAMKRDPELGLVFFQSSRKRYTHHTHCLRLDRTWFSGDLDDKNGETYLLLIADVNRRAWMQVSGSVAIRQYHQQGEFAR